MTALTERFTEHQRASAQKEVDFVKLETAMYELRLEVHSARTSFKVALYILSGTCAALGWLIGLLVRK